MNKRIIPAGATFCCLLIIFISNSCGGRNSHSVTIPFVTDHNRMLIEAEMMRKDGSWRKVILWVDSGNPVFTINADLARDLGIDLSEANKKDGADMRLDMSATPGLKIGGMIVNTGSIQATVKFKPYWLFTTMHCDGNLPSTVLKNYDVVFDYPGKKLTVAEPGTIIHEGISSDMIVNPETGIVQIMAELDGDSLCFALDNGASYSFISDEILSVYAGRHPDWPAITGTAGCANMWGWWPAKEQISSIVRIDEMKWGNTLLNNFGLVGVSRFGPEGPSLGEWYSGKTLKPVCGFLGANVLKAYRVDLDYTNHHAYFQKESLFDEHDMDIVGISIRQLPDSTYQVDGVVEDPENPSVMDLKTGDIIITINDLIAKGETMGKVVDALRGIPGDEKTIIVSRDGMTIKVKARVRRLL